MSFIYRDANYMRIVHEKVLIYVHLVANRHFESSTMLLIFLPNWLFVKRERVVRLTVDLT